MTEASAMDATVDEQLADMKARLDVLEKRVAARDADIRMLKQEVSTLRTRTYRLRQSGRY